MMEELRHGDVKEFYPEVIRAMQEKYANVKGVVVEITETDDIIKLSYGDSDLYLTSEQVVDLMRELKRAVVKINPKALRKKTK